MNLLTDIVNHFKAVNKFLYYLTRDYFNPYIIALNKGLGGVKSGNTLVNANLNIYSPPFL
jgi:hypothetical protein